MVKPRAEAIWRGADADAPFSGKLRYMGLRLS
jgi:hypothetical protein